MNGVSRTAKASQDNGYRNVNYFDLRIKIMRNNRGACMNPILKIKK